MSLCQDEFVGAPLNLLFNFADGVGLVQSPCVTSPRLGEDDDPPISFDWSDTLPTSMEWVKMSKKEIKQVFSSKNIDVIHDLGKNEGKYRLAPCSVGKSILVAWAIRTHICFNLQCTLGQVRV
jgi:hypothetical protein